MTHGCFARVFEYILDSNCKPGSNPPSRRLSSGEVVERKSRVRIPVASVFLSGQTVMLFLASMHSPP